MQQSLVSVHWTVSLDSSASQASHATEAALFESLCEVRLDNADDEGAVAEDDGVLKHERERIMPGSEDGRQRFSIIAKNPLIEAGGRVLAATSFRRAGIRIAHTIVSRVRFILLGLARASPRKEHRCSNSTFISARRNTCFSNSVEQQS